MTFACPQLTYLLRGLDQRPDFGCRVVGGDVTGFVTQKQLAILEPHASGAQPMTVRVASDRAPEWIEIPECGRNTSLSLDRAERTAGTLAVILWNLD